MNRLHQSVYCFQNWERILKISVMPRPSLALSQVSQPCHCFQVSSHFFFFLKQNLIKILSDVKNDYFLSIALAALSQIKWKKSKKREYLRCLLTMLIYHLFNISDNANLSWITAITAMVVNQLKLLNQLKLGLIIFV